MLVSKSLLTVFIVALFVQKIGASALPGLNPMEWRESFVKFNFDTSAGNDGSRGVTSTSQYRNVLVKTPFFNKKEKYWFSIYETKTFSFSSQTPFVAAGEAVPKKLHINYIGLGFVSHGEKTWGLWGAYKSQGDNYFSDLAQANIELSVVHFPQGRKQQGFWVWLLNYSSKRTFLKGWPLPGVAYVYKPSKKFFAVYGFPFVMVNYIDFPNTMVFSQISPFGVKARVAKGIFGPFMAFIKYKFSTESFILSQRKKEDNRLYYQSQRVDLGLFIPLSRKVILEAAVGYEFDRQMYMSQSIYSATLGREDFSHQWLLNGYLKYKF